MSHAELRFLRNPGGPPLAATAASLRVNFGGSSCAPDHVSCRPLADSPRSLVTLVPLVPLVHLVTLVTLVSLVTLPVVSHSSRPPLRSAAASAPAPAFQPACLVGLWPTPLVTLVTLVTLVPLPSLVKRGVPGHPSPRAPPPSRLR